MLQNWQQLLQLIQSPYTLILVFVAASWALVSLLKKDLKLTHVKNDDLHSERWLCRTLFRIKLEAFCIDSGELVSVVCPVQKDWVFAKNCMTGETGWLPQSSLELAKETGAKIENTRLKVMFKDHHLPVDSPPKDIAQGVIWCIFIFSPEGEVDNVPDLGNLKGHVAIVTLSQNSRRVTVGGPQKIDIIEPVQRRVDHHDFLETFSYIHTRLHPQRLIVIVTDTNESPLAALSGKWQGEESPNWLPMHQTAQLLERVHLRTPIALLVLNLPRKANLCTLHLFHQCCSVLIAARREAAPMALHPDVVQMLLSCPDLPLESLISIFILPLKMVAFKCDVYPKTAIVVKSFLNFVLSSLYFLRDHEQKMLFDKLYFLRECSNGMLADEFVDILGFCSAVKATIPNLHAFLELERDLSVCLRQMVVACKETLCSGLWLHMPTGLPTTRDAAVFSRYDTYLEYMQDFYSFYDFLPRLHKRITAIQSPTCHKRRTQPAANIPA